MSKNNFEIPVRPDDVFPALEELLAEVTNDNLHSEVNTDMPVGEEVW